MRRITPLHAHDCTHVRTRTIRTPPLLCRGGYFGRKTKTDVQLATLNPFWEEAFVPLAYLGTRSEPNPNPNPNPYP